MPARPLSERRRAARRITTMNPTSTHIISPPSIVDVATDAIRTLILSGDLAPGERLIEERLTERLGVSRPPIREALRVLQHEGLVLSLPRRGSVVAQIDADDVREIYSLRWALERLAIELIVPVTDRSVLDPLRDCIEEIRAAADAGDAQALLEGNLAFHLTLCGLPGHKRLLRAYESNLLQLRLCMAMNLRFRAQLYDDPQDAVRRHERLLAVIEAGDLDAIYAEIGTHGDRAFMSDLEHLIEPVTTPDPEE
jgi:DNA-binding GntR family transcriptional regulator